MYDCKFCICAGVGFQSAGSWIGSLLEGKRCNYRPISKTTTTTTTREKKRNKTRRRKGRRYMGRRKDGPKDADQAYSFFRLRDDLLCREKKLLWCPTDVGKTVWGVLPKRGALSSFWAYEADLPLLLSLSCRHHRRLDVVPRRGAVPALVMPSHFGKIVRGENHSNGIKATRCRVQKSQWRGRVLPPRLAVPSVLQFRPARALSLPWRMLRRQYLSIRSRGQGCGSVGYVIRPDVPIWLFWPVLPTWLWF